MWHYKWKRREATWILCNLWPLHRRFSFSTSQHPQVDLVLHNWRDRNQREHQMINGMWRWLLLDIRVKSGADVCSDWNWGEQDKKGAGHQQFDVDKLGDSRVKNSFISKLKNRFQALGHNVDKVGAAESAETWKATKNRRTMKKNL